MRTRCLCRSLSRQSTWTKHAATLKQCLLFQRCLQHQTTIARHDTSARGCYRSFNSSCQSCMIWGAKVPAKAAMQQQHDGRSLLDRYIFVKTLKNYYVDIPNGIILDTAYADSRPGDNFDPVVPVVVGLHDTPGSHHDLVPLLSRFAKMGCRTIAPTFPGHGNTQGMMPGFDDVFCQSTAEKAVFVHDFLGNLDIERVDLLISVGASCYPMMNLCAAQGSSNFYRSMACISPWPLQRPRYEPNQELTRKIQYMWERPYFRAPVRLLLPAYSVGEVKGTRDKITAAYLLNNLNIAEVNGLALAVSSRKIPRVVVFGELDHIVEKELYQDILDRLEIPQSNVSFFKGKLDSPRLPGALVFPDGGYDLHLKQPGVISAFLLKLLQIFHPNVMSMLRAMTEQIGAGTATESERQQVDRADAMNTLRESGRNEDLQSNVSPSTDRMQGFGLKIGVAREEQYTKALGGSLINTKLAQLVTVR